MDTEAPLAMGYIELLRWHIIDGMSARGEQGSTERKRDFVKEAGAMCGMKGNVVGARLLVFRCRHCINDTRWRQLQGTQGYPCRSRAGSTKRCAFNFTMRKYTSPNRYQTQHTNKRLSMRRPRKPFHAWHRRQIQNKTPSSVSKSHSG